MLEARVNDDFYGADLVRFGEFASVIGPIRKDVARQIDNDSAAEWYQRWSHQMIDRLRAADHSPLHPGRWMLRPLGLTTNKPPPLRDLTGLDPVDVETVLGNEDDDVYWDFGRGGTLVPLRLLADADDSNVKAWRKLVRENLLPPVLAWWVKPLQSWLIIDGHDRLVAAEAEGFFAPLLGLYELHSVEDARRRLRWTDEQEAERLERVTAAHPEETVAHEALAQGLARASVHVQEYECTTAWPARRRPHAQEV